MPRYLSPFLESWNRIEADPLLSGHLDAQGLLSLWARKELRDAPLPDSALGALVRQRRRKSAAVYSVYRQRVDPILEELLRESLPVIALKGVVFAETLFESPADRQMGDVDIWCPGDAAIEALSIALSRGWTVDPLYQDVPTGTFGDHAEINLISPGRDVALDLHRLLVPPHRFRLDQASFAERARAVAHLPAGVRALEPQDNLLFLSIHLAGHHGWEGIVRNWEVAKLWNQQDGSQKNQIRENATRAGCWRSLQVALEVARRFLEADVSPGLLDLRGRLWVSLIETMLARQAAGGRFSMRPAEWATLFFQADRFSDNLRYLITTAMSRGVRSEK